MPTTYVEAVDAILGAFNAAWQANTTAICGYIPKVYWPNVEEEDSPPTNLHWARATIQTVEEYQTTLRGEDKDLGFGKRYESNGIVIIQLFFSKATLKNGDDRKLMEVAKKSFMVQVANGSVWFRDANKRELNPEESWYRANVSARWQYDEIITF